jgi:two-component system sensor histidine kinase KdpD
MVAGNYTLDEAVAIDCARSHNLSRIAIGCVTESWPWRQPRSRNFARLAADIDLIHADPGCG